jgi:hypothetical protein
MLLSTFIAGLSGNRGQQVTLQMPATLDQARQIAIRVFEAETQEKKFCNFFRILKPTENVEATLVNSGRPLENQSTYVFGSMPEPEFGLSYIITA